MTGERVEPDRNTMDCLRIYHFSSRHYLSKLLAHLVGFSRHGHQLDVVVPDGEQTGVSLTGGLPLTQVDALSSHQLRLEVVVVVPPPLVRSSLRGIAHEQVGAV